jgi:hypothetical protein
MALDNVAELTDVLRRRERLGKVFARHAYGMRAWVDLFSARVAGVQDPELKTLVATLVADNARHMMIFRERAIAYGIDPDAYACPPEGEAIYERIVEIDSLDELLGYALGSLDHFDELLTVYRTAADGPDADAIDEVLADVTRMRAALRPLCGPEAARLAAEAHELYRVREIVETPRYAHAG